MNKTMWKTHSLITHNLTHNLNQTQTRRGNKIKTHRLLYVWRHWGTLAHLLEGGDHLRESLANALDTITNKIAEAQGALYNISLYRESKRQYYSDGLTSKTLKLQKTSYFHYFGTLAPDWFHPLVDHTFP